VEVPEQGHATYVFSRPGSLDYWVRDYSRTARDDILRNRNNAAERLGFIGRVMHGRNPRSWLRELRAKIRGLLAPPFPEGIRWWAAAIQEAPSSTHCVACLGTSFLRVGCEPLIGDTNSPWEVTIHSCRSARIGSTRIARWAGT
jgi:hypothetical protein